ncbi:MAG TPA: phosphoribosylamine--glycine ligase [Candidatus Avidehalobacter gallistercoris]|uniref:Phosphoribosylamine--glycine ligase n=1 Tax=Candidatus Avidehalobacter gallistercoris TaxID=2840694 RepID=A0A9D1HKQ1_9FIRM|nr:phosphoribosylamine--glycine ligase [Candidatus Avidehalobacter gallistercoris]
MKILVVGGGGREHAIVWKLAQSPLADEIYCAPGNAGIAHLADCVNIPAEDVDALLDFAQAENIDLTVVGPEAPLSLGIVDKFMAAGLRIFGPSQSAALIEGSKELAKQIMAKYGIPTAKYMSFTDKAQALAYVREQGAPIVVKADGLAAGKGVVVAETVAEAEQAVEDMLGGAFGAAGAKVVIEEFLKGEEVSVLAFTDGHTVLPMVSAQDHKRVFDGDKGPNTGGMGAYSPAPVYTPEMAEQVLHDVLQPAVDGMRAEGRLYKGVLYAGLMVTPEGVKVLEFNARFGDPETQAVLMRLKSDLVEIMLAVIDGTLQEKQLEWYDDAAVCVVIASDGYPGHYAKGQPISGLDDDMPDTYVFHAGTAYAGQHIVANGGRVLGVTARGADIRQAIERVYLRADEIYYDGCFCRRDIGHRALDRENK